VHGFRCYDNTHVCKLIVLYTANVYSAEREMSASACTRCMAGSVCGALLRLSLKPPSQHTIHAYVARRDKRWVLRKSRLCAQDYSYADPLVG